MDGIYLSIEEVCVISAALFVISAVVFLIRRKSLWRHLFVTALVIYMLFAASQTVLPIDFIALQAQYSPGAVEIYRNCLHLIPFDDGLRMENLLNVLLTIPFGFLLPLVTRRFLWYHAAIFGVIFGVGAELIQLLTAASVRFVDTADVICNFAGTMLGWLIAFAAIQLIKQKYSGDSEKHLLGYLSSREVN